METTGESDDRVPDMVSGTSDDHHIMRELTKLRCAAGVSQTQIAKRMKRSIHEVRKAEERVTDEYLGLEFFLEYLNALGYQVQCIPGKTDKKKTLQFFKPI